MLVWMPHQMEMTGFETLWYHFKVQFFFEKSDEMKGNQQSFYFSLFSRFSLTNQNNWTKRRRKIIVHFDLIAKRHGEIRMRISVTKIFYNDCYHFLYSIKFIVETYCCYPHLRWQFSHVAWLMKFSLSYFTENMKK